MLNYAMFVQCLISGRCGSRNSTATPSTRTGRSCHSLLRVNRCASARSRRRLSAESCASGAIGPVTRDFTSTITIVRRSGPRQIRSASAATPPRPGPGTRALRAMIRYPCLLRNRAASRSPRRPSDAVAEAARRGRIDRSSVDQNRRGLPLLPIGRSPPPFKLKRPIPRRRRIDDRVDHVVDAREARPLHELRDVEVTLTHAPVGRQRVEDLQLHTGV